MQERKAFTLLELLLIVAIVGILLAFGAFALSSARKKAWDGAIRTNLTQVRQVAAYIYNEEGAYSSLCAGGTLNSSYPQLEEISKKVKEKNGGVDVTCYASEERFCVQSPLNSGQYFCLDWTGRAFDVLHPFCDDTNFDCI